MKKHNLLTISAAIAMAAGAASAETGRAALAVLQTAGGRAAVLAPEVPPAERATETGGEAVNKDRLLKMKNVFDAADALLPGEFEKSGLSEGPAYFYLDNYFGEKRYAAAGMTIQAAVAGPAGFTYYIRLGDACSAAGPGRENAPGDIRAGVMRVELRRAANMLVGKVGCSEFGRYSHRGYFVLTN